MADNNTTPRRGLDGLEWAVLIFVVLGFAILFSLPFMSAERRAEILFWLP